MCFFSSPSPPPPPPLPATPSRDDPEILGRQFEERRRVRGMEGRRATILTGGLGDPSFSNTANTPRRTLLGQAA